jgi:hypothetical protein
MVFCNIKNNQMFLGNIKHNQMYFTLLNYIQNFNDKS